MLSALKAGPAPKDPKKYGQISHLIDGIELEIKQLRLHKSKPTQAMMEAHANFGNADCDADDADGGAAPPNVAADGGGSLAAGGYGATAAGADGATGNRATANGSAAATRKGAAQPANGAAGWASSQKTTRSPTASPPGGPVSIFETLCGCVLSACGRKQRQMDVDDDGVGGDVELGATTGGVGSGSGGDAAPMPENHEEPGAIITFRNIVIVNAEEVAVAATPTGALRRSVPDEFLGPPKRIAFRPCTLDKFTSATTVECEHEHSVGPSDDHGGAGSTSHGAVLLRVAADAACAMGVGGLQSTPAMSGAAADSLGDSTALPEATTSTAAIVARKLITLSVSQVLVSGHGMHTPSLKPTPVEV